MAHVHINKNYYTPSFFFFNISNSFNERIEINVSNVTDLLELTFGTLQNNDMCIEKKTERKFR